MSTLKSSSTDLTLNADGVGNDIIFQSNAGQVGSLTAEGILTATSYAGTGYQYDSKKDAFISPKPYPSWTLVEDTCQWTAPVAYPDDGKVYGWNEATTNWVEIE